MIILLLLSLFLPLIFSFLFHYPHFGSLAGYYAINAASFFYLYNKKIKVKVSLNFEIQDLQEKINILTAQNSQLNSNISALVDKSNRYHGLKEIIEMLNQNLDLDYVAGKLVEIVFSTIAKGKGVCVFYLIDKETKRPVLFKSKKENKELILKTKEGDIFDFWVLRHLSPLLVDDARNDFRFELQKPNEDSRQILSLISSPFISENKFLAIIRLDNSTPDFYSQDDLRFLAAISDIGAVVLENSELFQKTRHLAIHDGLTSLYTKGYFLDRLKEECKGSIRHKKPIGLIMLDIDHFKNYNDKFGHTAGDIVLKNLGSNLTDFVKNGNAIVSRFGGEEFCIAFPGKDKSSLKPIADALRKAIENTKILLRRQENKITVSIGVASLPDDAVDEDELIRNADKAMYQAKQKGRNRVVVC